MCCDESTISKLVIATLTVVVHHYPVGMEKSKDEKKKVKFKREKRSTMTQKDDSLVS